MGNAAWAVALAVLVVIAVAAVAYAAGQAKTAAPKVVRAERFELVNGEGQLLASLGTSDKDAAGLDLFDQEGDLRASLAVSADADGVPNLWLFDRRGAMVGMTVESNGSPVIGLTDTEGNVRVNIAALPGGISYVNLKDSTGNARVSLWSSGDDGRSSLEVRGKEDKTRLSLRISGDGSASLDMGGKQGLPSVRLSRGSDGSPRLLMGDGAGNVVWKAP
jgi:hypothetical protein